MLLLQKLGFYLPVSTGKTFVRIPNFWNAEHIFSIAQQLGPIDPGNGVLMTIEMHIFY